MIGGNRADDDAAALPNYGDIVPDLSHEVASTPTRLDVPNLNLAIDSSGHEARAVVVEACRVDRSVVTFENLKLLTGPHVPESSSGVVAGAAELPESPPAPAPRGYTSGLRGPTYRHSSQPCSPINGTKTQRVCSCW